MYQLAIGVLRLRQLRLQLHKLWQNSGVNLLVFWTSKAFLLRRRSAT